MDSNGNGRESGKQATYYTDAGFSYGAGWPIVRIETPWAVGCQEHIDDDGESLCVGTEKLETGLLSEEDVARLLNISAKTVQQLVREKKLGCVQLTKRKRAFTLKLIDDFIRRESGVLPGRRKGSTKHDPLSHRPVAKPVPIEEARDLLKKTMKRK